jgi:rubrerythrin
VQYGDAVGRALADQARLEAASVHAFRRLGAELASMRAPRSLVRAAERSARDEVRHARVMSRLARRHGAVPAPVKLGRRRSVRSLESFAVENAVEGCVRECFGALVATRQATHAGDPELAREMKRIARDETRHAALAWGIARWVERRLSPAGRASVRRAMGEAFGALRREVEATPAATARVLGLPAGGNGAELVDAFEAALFS